MFNTDELNIVDVVRVINKADIPCLKLKTQFIMSDELMSELEIEKMELKYEDKFFPEIWTFVKFDGTNKEFTKLRRYIVSTYGRVYDVKKFKIAPQRDSSKFSSTATGERYRVVSLHLMKGYTILRGVHRLVALAFLKKKKGKNVVDHIDETPSHNYVWNLQWTDKSGNCNKHNMFVQRQRTGKCVDTRWKYEELVAICKMMAEGHKATYIYHEMLKLTNNDPKIQYERIRTLYKHIMRRGDFHDIAVKCGVKFGSDTLKEKGSVEKAQQEKTNEENKETEKTGTNDAK